MRTSDMRKEARKLGLVEIHHFVFPFSFLSLSLLLSLPLCFFQCVHLLHLHLHLMLLLSLCSCWPGYRKGETRDEEEEEKERRTAAWPSSQDDWRGRGRQTQMYLRMLADEEATSGHIYLLFYIQRIRSSKWTDRPLSPLKQWLTQRGRERERFVCSTALSLTAII